MKDKTLAMVIMFTVAIAFVHLEGCRSQKVQQQSSSESVQGRDQLDLFVHDLGYVPIRSRRDLSPHSVLGQTYRQHTTIGGVQLADEFVPFDGVLVDELTESDLRWMKGDELVVRQIESGTITSGGLQFGRAVDLQAGVSEGSHDVVILSGIEYAELNPEKIWRIPAFRHGTEDGQRQIVTGIIRAQSYVIERAFANWQDAELVANFLSREIGAQISHKSGSKNVRILFGGNPLVIGVRLRDVRDLKDSRSYPKTLRCVDSAICSHLPKNNLTGCANA